MKRKLETGFGRIVEVQPDGSQEWSTGKMRWSYRSTGGVNLWGAEGGGDLMPCVHAKTLPWAAMFAEGYEAGLMYGKQPAPEPTV